MFLIMQAQSGLIATVTAAGNVNCAVPKKGKLCLFSGGDALYSVASRNRKMGKFNLKSIIC